MSDENEWASSHAHAGRAIQIQPPHMAATAGHRSPTLRGRLLLGTAAFALAAGLLMTAPGGIANALTTQRSPQSALLAESQSTKSVQMPDFVDLVKAIRPAVVSVRVKSKAEPQLSALQGENPFKGTPFEKFFGPFGEPGHGFNGSPAKPHMARGEGSAFFISADGYLVTNNHVVNEAVEVEIVMDDGTTMPAKVVGADPKTDIALLKVSGRADFPFVKLSDSTPPVGSWVVAMGNPFGLGGTVTAGIVSAKGRDIGNGPYDDFIQIDASVNRGNSGGPTIDMKGEVVGVNTAIFSPSGGNVGIAFDIPAPVVTKVVAQLRDKGYVDRGWLGVQIQPVTGPIADSLGLKSAQGALISSPQSESPAARAGLKSGDIITKVNDQDIKDARDLARTISSLPPGTTVSLTVLRDGQTKEVTAQLGQLKSEPQKLAHSSSTGDGVGKLGLEVSPASRVEGAGDEGLAVLAVDPDGPAAELGIQPGDVIKKVGNDKVSSVADLQSALAKAKGNGREHSLALIQHDKTDRYVALPVG